MLHQCLLQTNCDSSKPLQKLLFYKDVNLFLLHFMENMSWNILSKTIGLLSIWVLDTWIFPKSLDCVVIIKAFDNMVIQISKIQTYMMQFLCVVLKQHKFTQGRLKANHDPIKGLLRNIEGEHFIHQTKCLTRLLPHFRAYSWIVFYTQKENTYP